MKFITATNFPVIITQETFMHSRFPAYNRSWETRGRTEQTSCVYQTGARNWAWGPNFGSVRDQRQRLFISNAVT